MVPEGPQDVLFLTVYMPVLTFLVMGGQNLITEAGVFVLILICLMNARSLIR